MTTHVIPTGKVARSPLVPILIGAVIAFVLIGLTVALLRSGVSAPNSGRAPDFALTTFDGQPFTLSGQQGKVTVINFWASWCNTCPGEAPILNALWNDYQPKGVAMIGIAHLDNRGDSLGFISQYTMRYPAAPDDGNHASDAYHIRQVPETYVIDQHGQVAYAVHGPLDANSALLMRAKIDQLLTTPPATASSGSAS